MSTVTESSNTTVHAEQTRGPYGINALAIASLTMQELHGRLEQWGYMPLNLMRSTRTVHSQEGVFTTKDNHLVMILTDKKSDGKYYYQFSAAATPDEPTDEESFHLLEDHIRAMEQYRSCPPEVLRLWLQVEKQHGVKVGWSRRMTRVRNRVMDVVGTFAPKNVAEKIADGVSKFGMRKRMSALLSRKNSTPMVTTSTEEVSVEQE